MPRGEGYLRKRGKVWYFEFMYKGKRYYEKIGAVSKTVAKEIANEIRSQIIRGEYIPQKERSITFLKAAEEYVKWYKQKFQGRESTLKKHLSRVNTLVNYFGKYYLHNITYFTIEHYKRKRVEDGVSKSTINKELAILRSIFNRAKEFGFYSGEIPKIEKFKDVENERVRFLTPEEAKRLIEACPEWFRAVVVFALNTGLRAGEIFTLKWSQVDFRNRFIYVEPSNTKTKKVYKVPMNETVYKLLLRLKEEHEEKKLNHDYVFTNSRGEPYSEQGYRKVFQSACERAGIKNFRFHDLRHTFASWVAMKSKDIYAVQILLHHSDPSVTKRYAHLTEDYLREVVGNISAVFR